MECRCPTTPLALRLSAGAYEAGTPARPPSLRRRRPSPRVACLRRGRGTPNAGSPGGRASRRRPPAGTDDRPGEQEAVRLFSQVALISELSVVFHFLSASLGGQGRGQRRRPSGAAVKGGATGSMSARRGGGQRRGGGPTGWPRAGATRRGRQPRTRRPREGKAGLRGRDVRGRDARGQAADRVATDGRPTGKAFAGGATSGRSRTRAGRPRARRPRAGGVAKDESAYRQGESRGRGCRARRA